MKKVLTLVLVLAVAQLASAAVSWDTTQVGDTLFSVTLTSDENVKNVQIGQMVSDGTTFEVSPLQDTSVWDASFTGSSTSGFFDLSEFGEAGYGNALGQITEAGAFASGNLLNFTVTGEVGDIITVQNLDAFSVNSFIATEATGGSVLISDFDGGSLESFELVPEPMTMALLGLGGLFIRRRRA